MGRKAVALLLFLQFAMLRGHVYRIKTGSYFGDSCSYTGYAPEGNEVVVKRITAPMAKLQGSVMATVMSNGGKAATGVMHGLNMVAQLSKSFSLIPGIGPALGAFGVVFGALGAASKPTPADILKATNKAIDKLTKEVNDRMDEMKGYVDKKVIDLEKSLITREYRSLFILWSNCIVEKGAEQINECQRDAAATIIAAKPKFQIGVKDTSVYNVKRLEASLIAFRDYATLSVMCLKALVDTYKAGEPAADTHYYNLYVRQLKEQVESFATYLNAAVKLIVNMHYNGGKGSCHDTLECNGLHEIREGFWLTKVHTASWTECGCSFDPANPKTKKCSIRTTIRTDGKSVGNPYKLYYTSASTYYSACQGYAESLLMTNKGNAYLSTMKTTIENTWKNEVLDLLPAWETVAGLREAKKRDEDSLGYYRDENDLAFSDNYRWRLAVANQMAEDFGKNYKNAVTVADYASEDDKRNDDAGGDLTDDASDVNKLSRDIHRDDDARDFYDDDVTDDASDENEFY